MEAVVEALGQRADMCGAMYSKGEDEACGFGKLLDMLAKASGRLSLSRAVCGSVDASAGTGMVEPLWYAAGLGDEVSGEYSDTKCG